MKQLLSNFEENRKNISQYLLGTGTGSKTTIFSSFRTWVTLCSWHAILVYIRGVNLENPSERSIRCGKLQSTLLGRTEQKVCTVRFQVYFRIHWGLKRKTPFNIKFNFHWKLFFFVCLSFPFKKFMNNLFFSKYYFNLGILSNFKITILFYFTCN